MSAKSIGRYVIALFVSWWTIALVIGGIGVLTVGHAAAAVEVWVLGLAAIVAFWVQTKLHFGRSDIAYSMHPTATIA